MTMVCFVEVFQYILDLVVRVFEKYDCYDVRCSARPSDLFSVNVGAVSLCQTVTKFVHSIKFAYSVVGQLACWIGVLASWLADGVMCCWTQ